MLRVKILASSLPLILAGLVAGGDLVPGTQPCISLGNASLQMATAPWQNQLHVSFTDDPAKATVRVQLVDRADIADFVVVDDDMNTADPEIALSPRKQDLSASQPMSRRRSRSFICRKTTAPTTGFLFTRRPSPCASAALVVSAGRNNSAPKTASL